MIDVNTKKNATRFVLLTVFTYSIGFGIIMPVLPELIVELEGVSFSRATLLGGYLAASYAMFQFLMGPLVGNLGDRFGRRPVFLLSLAGFSIDFLLMGFTQDLLWLFVGRSIAGALGAIFGPANAVMADISTDDERAKSFGMVGAAFGIGFMIGPALGGLLGELGTRVPFFVSSALAATTFIYGLVAFDETMPEQSRRPFSFKRANPVGALMNLRKLPDVLGIAAVYLVWITSIKVYPVSWAYFAPIKFDWDSKMVGLSLTVVGVSLAIVQTLALGRFVARFGERNTAIIGVTTAAAVMLLNAFTVNGYFALAACTLIGLQGLVMPSINAMMSRRTPKDRQGELQGFNGSLTALAALIAPLVYNSSLSYFTSDDAVVYLPGIPFILSASLALVTLITLIFLKPSRTNSM